MFSKKYANNYNMDMVQGIFTKEQFQVKVNEDDYQKFIEAYISSEFESKYNSFIVFKT